MVHPLVIIFSFVIIITIVAGFIINGVVRKVLDYKREKQLGGKSPAQVAQLEERTAAIEDRLMVLERIATDPEARRGAELAQEIESLRLEQETPT